MDDPPVLSSPRGVGVSPSHARVLTSMGRSPIQARVDPAPRLPRVITFPQKGYTDAISPTLYIILALPFCIIPLTMAAQWYAFAQDHRRRRRVVRKPVVIPTGTGNIPSILRDRLGQLTHSLRSLGFEAVANGHARLTPELNWTQVVFVRRDTCDRVSVFCLHNVPARKASLNYIFATDAADGTSVKTAVGTETTPNANYRSAGDPTSPETAAAAYAAHRRRVDDVLHDTPPIPMPPPGDEMTWLSARLVELAASLATRNRLVPLSDGIWYGPRWTDALRATRSKVFLISRFVKQRDIGFEVTPSTQAPE